MSASPDDECDRAIIVSRMPERTTTEHIKIHFENTKNGGEVEKITLLRESQAKVVFKDLEGAEKAIKTRQIYRDGNDLEVMRLETYKEKQKKLRNKEGNKGKEARQILVSGFHKDATENNIYIHFQKKKNGGGEVEKVELKGEGKAIVIFEDPEVAKRVVDMYQIMKGKVLHVELVETETQNTETVETSAKEFPAVLVTGLPAGTTENGVHIHFQKKKNGGGEIKEVKLQPDKNTATVVFEDIDVAKRVVSTPQLMKGNHLGVQLQEAKRSHGEKSVLVSGLPEGVTEKEITIHFQKKRNNGGDVEKVFLLSESTAIVIFEDPEVAKMVVTTPQKMKEKPLTVSFLSLTLEKTATEEDGKVKPEEEMTLEGKMTETSRKEKSNVAADPEVFVSPKTERLPETRMITDEMRQMEEKAIAGRILQSVDPVFSMVSATVNPALISTASQYFWSDIFNVIHKSFGVLCQPSAYGFLFTGTLSQVVKAGEMLEHYRKKHLPDLDHPNKHLNQNNMNFNQGDMNFQEQGTVVNYARMNPGTDVNQKSSHLNQNMYQSEMSLNHHFPQRPAEPNEAAQARHHHGANNSTGSPFGQGVLVNSGQTICGGPNGGQLNVSQAMTNSHTRELSNASYDQRPHQSHGDTDHFNQSPHGKYPGSVAATTFSQHGYPSDISRSPHVDETVGTGLHEQMGSVTSTVNSSPSLSQITVASTPQDSFSGESVQPPVNNQLTGPNGSTRSGNQCPSRLPEGTTDHHKLPGDYRNRTPSNSSPAELMTSGNDPLGLPSEFRGIEKSPDLTETTISPGEISPSDQPGAMTEPNIAPKNVTNPTTTKIPTTNTTTSNTTNSTSSIEAQNSSTAEKEIEVPSTNMPGSVDEKEAVAQASKNQPLHNEQQTDTEQPNSTPEIQHNETSTEASSAVPNLSEKLDSTSESDPNSDNKPERKTPIPAPRLNKSGTGERRQNAANFSGKVTQARQGIPSPTVPNNSTSDSPTPLVERDKENERNLSAQNSEKEINDSRLELELD